MGGFCDYLELAALDAIFGSGSPANIAVGLSSTQPTDAGGNITEPGSNYARVTKTNNVANFPAATGPSPGTKANGTEIVFATAAASWGSVGYFFITDNGANVLGWGSLTGGPFTIGAGVTPKFAVGALQITLD